MNTTQHKNETTNQRPGCNRTYRRTSAIVAGVWMLTLAAPFACTEATESIDIVKDAESIIGGHHATAPSLNHTGSLIMDLNGDMEPFCSATLIGPKTIVTAKHCTEVAQWGYDIYFGVGPDGYQPEERIPVVAFEKAPLDEGGAVGMGRDVAVMYLSHIPSGEIIPALPMPSADLNPDDRMVSIGYGVFTAREAFDGQRRIGRETVIATEGLIFEALLSDFESFVEWMQTNDVSDANYLELVDEAYAAYLWEIYQSEVLLEGDEAAAGGGDNDTQTCFGDSGGPLMKYVPGSGWQTFGVVSGGISSRHSVCDFGTVFATFGPEVMSFLEAAKNWEDPCGDAGEFGICDNNVAVNCITNLGEGTRTRTEQNCDEVGQTCVLVEDGAFCGTVPPASNQNDTPNIAVHSISEVREAVRDAYFFRPY